MTNAPCTELSQAEEMKLMRAFPAFLSDAEEAAARQFFEPLVFFRQAEEDRSQRWCVCTSCMEGFYAGRKISPDFFKATHGKPCTCPNCGQASALAAMGKFTSFESLTSRERAVQLTACGDWLLVQAGWITRTFDHEDLGGYLDFEPFRRYAFAPGRRAMWSASGVGGSWTREERIREPFAHRPHEREAAYILLNAEALTVSSLRWCQYERWFSDEYGGDPGGLDWEEEPFRIAYLINYLAEYTRRPQMEFLAKLGHHDVLRELVIARRAHGDLLDWNARTPAAFFRLSKAEYRAFAGAGLGIAALAGWRAQSRRGISFQAFLRAKKEFKDDFGRLMTCQELSNASLNQAMHYLRRQAGQARQPLHHALDLWLDYLTNARQLGYDLARADVALPKDLQERHDLAAAAVTAIREEEFMKRYAARYRKLAEQFEFASDGLCVIVPKRIQDIIDEGKLLQHCVGGYGERHVKGAVTILFLRKMKNPEAPYVTMEVSTENNCAKLRIIQIHGFQNDRHAKEPPEVRHAGFLDLWLGWVRDGSRRDGDGRPVLPAASQEVSIA